MNASWPSRSGPRPGGPAHLSSAPQARRAACPRLAARASSLRTLGHMAPGLSLQTCDPGPGSSGPGPAHRVGGRDLSVTARRVT
jgi:hypothetical protein